jgi:hypothetical protein
MRALVILKAVFTTVGLGLLAGAAYWVVSTRAFVARAEVATGTVVDLARSTSSDSTTYRPVVQFRTRAGEPIEFESSTGSNPPSYQKGEQVEVLYLPGEPSRARIRGLFSLWGGPMILGSLGVVFFGVGGGMVFASVLSKRRAIDLRQHGTPIQAVFQRVQLNGQLSVNGRNPFQVVCQWHNPATGKIHVFTSQNLWYDPSDYIQDRNLTVYLDQDHPSRYLVDLSFLPELAS